MKTFHVLSQAAALALAIGWTAPAWAQDDGPVKIGVLEDMSTSYADITGAGSVAAAELAIEDFGGTVLGRPIELLSADHQNKADIASNIARQWYDVDGVQMITGLGNSAAALAVRTLAAERGKVDIVTGAASSTLTGENCSPTGFHWAYNNYGNSKVVSQAVVGAGGDSWYFLTVDYAFGHSLESDATAFIEQAGGTVLGSVRMPLGTNDFASFLLQAQASGSKIVNIAAAGSDLVNAIKQAGEFGLVDAGQDLAAMVVMIQDIHALGPQVAQGLYLTESFYWDMTDETRAWSERFEEKVGMKPNMLQAGIYSAVTHYLRAMDQAGTDDGLAVADAMKAFPVEDFYTDGATVRDDGLVARNMYLFRVKSPDQSAGEWDLYELISTVKGDDAFLAIGESRCALVTND